MTKKQESKRKGESLGQYLRKAREQAGLSKLHLEAVSGVGRMSISRLEDDYYKEPSPDDLVRLARALELNEADLFLLAGLPVPRQNASMEVMLRAGYGVPDEAVPELKRRIEALIAEQISERKTIE